MTTISWETDAGGTPAITKQSRDRKFISPSASALLVKGLMHEVINISAGFFEDDVIVFSRIVGISTIDEKVATFYGLYVSNGAADGPNYCIRRCLWSREFGSIEEVLRGLSAQTLFFNANELSSEMREIVDLADSPSKDEWQTFSQRSDDVRFAEKNVRYFVADDLKDMSCNYSGKSSSNPLIEKLFGALEVLFDALSVSGAIFPIADSLRISYTFQYCTEVLTQRS